MRTNEKHIPQGSDIGGKKGGFLQGGAGSTWWWGMVGRRMMLKSEAGLERTSGVQKREGDSQAPLG